jgi:MFS family permease
MLKSHRLCLQSLSSNVKIFLLGNAIQAMGMAIYSLLFNLYLKELGYGEAAIGELISTSSLGIAMMAIPAALFIERFHVKHLVLTGMVVSSTFYFIQIQNSDATLLFTFGLMASMFQALFNISVSPFYLRNSTPSIRVQLFTLNSTLNIGAQFIGFFLGGYLPAAVRYFQPGLVNVESFRLAMTAALGLVFLSNIIFLRIKPVPIPRMRKRFLQGIKEKEWPVLIRLILPKICLAFGGGLIVPFLNIYLSEKFGFSSKRIGVSYAALQVFIIIGIALAPFLVKRMTHLKFMLTTTFLAVPFMVAMGLTTNPMLVVSCFFMRGMLMNMTSPITSMFEMEHVKEHNCVFASAMIMFSYHTVYTVSTRLGGLLIEEFSFGPTFYVAGACYGTAAILYMKFFKDEKMETRITETPPEPLAEAA